MEPTSWIALGSAALGAIGKFGGGKQKMSSAYSSATAIGGQFGSGAWNVATSGAKTAGQLPVEILVLGGIVALLIWKKVK